MLNAWGSPETSSGHVRTWVSVPMHQIISTMQSTYPSHHTVQRLQDEGHRLTPSIPTSTVIPTPLQLGGFPSYQNLHHSFPSHYRGQNVPPSATLSGPYNLVSPYLHGIAHQHTVPHPRMSSGVYSAYYTIYSSSQHEQEGIPPAFASFNGSVMTPNFFARPNRYHHDQVAVTIVSDSFPCRPHGDSHDAVKGPEYIHPSTSTSLSLDPTATESAMSNMALPTFWRPPGGSDDACHRFNTLSDQDYAEVGTHRYSFIGISAEDDEPSTSSNSSTHTAITLQQPHLSNVTGQRYDKYCSIKGGDVAVEGQENEHDAVTTKGRAKTYRCRWGSSCGMRIGGEKHHIRRHLHKFHGVSRGQDGSNICCSWPGCGKTIRKGSLPRHVSEVHFHIKRIYRASSGVQGF
ncbi:hypothetical protein F5I97DRAFT_227326 [Phlebopus sp. FC_14]|nr:hypothetical protein F5I97DRAFT_227326 [Phlebopus sp. FC_14]